jgi:RNA-directed DNA polymerase
MTRPSISLQDLRRRIYAKAKAEPSWRFWGLFVHVCKEETLHEAYRLAKKNDGAPGVDGVSFVAIEEGGVDVFIGQIRDELVSRRYAPMPNRRKEIPKDGGKKVRVLGIPLYPRPRGPGCATTHPGADLRGRVSRVPAGADGT